MARGRPSKKDHIVKVASGLFTEQGYQSTSIDQVVLAAAVSKPTVYSNFPAKLVLWEKVLTLLTEQAQKDMQVRLTKLQKQANSALIDGWITLWEEWVNTPEHLAVYRILLGEQHKMADSTFALFAEFEKVLETTLMAWIDRFSVSPMNFFALKAVSKEALLMPALFNQKKMEKKELTQQLNSLMTGVSFQNG